MNRFLNIQDLIGLAFEALKKNRMRTVLSVVGIVIGISTLVLVLGISGAAEGFIRDQLASFGTDTIFVQVQVPNAGNGASQAAIASGVQVKTLKMDDVLGVRKIPNVKDSYGVAIAQQKVAYRSNSKTTFVYGASPSFVNIDSSKIDVGRYFTQADEDSLARVAVLGSNIKHDLFADEDPIGKMIRIKGFNFKIVGVMQKRGAAFFQNNDDYVFLPLRTEQKLLLGYDYLPYFVIQVKDPKYIELTVDDVSRFLRRQHHIEGNDTKKDDFSIEDSKSSLDTINVVFGAISLLFGAIASISLVVGGVGIMNIMYVSVTERIREIGLRKAVGARRRDILLQFLFESVVITLLGGVLGIISGILLTTLISFGAKAAGIHLDMSLSPIGILLGLLVTSFFGIVFGFGPARKAAGLQPIEALRSD